MNKNRKTIFIILKQILGVTKGQMMNFLETTFLLFELSTEKLILKKWKDKIKEKSMEIKSLREFHK